MAIAGAVTSDRLTAKRRSWHQLRRDEIFGLGAFIM
jgi:hypothetical protein